MSPGQYTELFFLDEATALAAGHRPCATCRRDDYSRFTQLWIEANTDRLAFESPSIKDIDETLHQERLVSGGQQDDWHPLLGDLPDGTFVILDDPDTAWLVRENELLQWSPGGYLNHMRPPDRQAVTVLTPRSTVAALAAGYVPELHPSAGATSVDRSSQPWSISSTHAFHDTLKSAHAQRGKPAYPKAPPEAPSAKPVKEPPEQAVPVTGKTLFKLRKTPAGKSLFTYTAAILKVTGMDQGKTYPLKKFLGNFSGHEKAGRIQKVPGGYQLTSAGIDYFNDRYNPGSRQHIVRSEVEAMVRLMRKGGGPDWVPVS